MRLWQEPVEGFLRSGVAALPLATLCQLPEGQPLPEALRTVVREIDCRLGKEVNEAEAAKLMMAAYILTGLRVDKSDLASIYRGVGLMGATTAFDEAIEEGEARGELKRSHRLILRLGRKPFGDPDVATQARLTAITDLDRLERLAEAIFTANSWEELLATP